MPKCRGYENLSMVLVGRLFPMTIMLKQKRRERERQIDRETETQKETRDTETVRDRSSQRDKETEIKAEEGRENKTCMSKGDRAKNQQGGRAVRAFRKKMDWM